MGVDRLFNRYTTRWIALGAFAAALIGTVCCIALAGPAAFDPDTLTLSDEPVGYLDGTWKVTVSDADSSGTVDTTAVAGTADTTAASDSSEATQTDEGLSVMLPYRVKSRAGEKVTYTITLPDEMDEADAVSFLTVYQDVDVAVDGVVVYTWQRPDGAWLGKAAPSTWNFVHLGEGKAGSTLSITLSSPYAHSNGGLASVMVGDYQQLRSHVLMNFTPFIGMCGAALLLGIYLSVLFVTLGRYIDDFKALYHLGLFVFCASVFMLTMHKVPAIILNDYICGIMNSLMLLVTPIPAMLYTRERIIRLGTKTPRWIIDAFLTLQILNFVVCTVLELTGLLAFHETVVTSYVMIPLFAAYVLYLRIVLLRHDRSPEVIVEFIATIILILTIIIELALSLTMNYTLWGVFLLGGILVYTLALVVASTMTITRRMRERERIAEQLRDSQLELMRGQIKPHFIYNTLNAVYGQIEVAPDVASEMIYNFSKYLRANIDSADQAGVIAFDAELENVKSYSYIEQTRFAGRVKVDYDIRCDGFYVPPLSIQPLVENAIKHGLRARSEGGTVTVATHEEDDAYIITVSDDGVGFDMDAADAGAVRGAQSMRAYSTGANLADEHTGSGLRNVRLRLREMVDATLDVQSKPGSGTVVTVRIPKPQHIREEMRGA